MSTTIQKPSEATVRHMIAVRAYLIWENHGRPRGYDVINWHQAEREVLAMLAENAQPVADDPR